MSGSVTCHPMCHVMAICLRFGALAARVWYTSTMRERTPEPGFVQAYRLFVMIRIIFWLVVGPVLVLLELAGNPGLSPEQVAGQPLIQQMAFPNIAPLLFLEVLLLGLLSWPLAPHRLGRWFVPLTLLIGIAPLLVGYYWWPAENPLQSPFVMFFFVTVLLIAWEYQYRYVFAYVFGLTVFQALVSPWPTQVPWTVPVGWLVLQGVMMLLAGYVTATLVSVQREQRTALAQAYRQQAEANEQLQQYATTLEELSISRERNRLARELHDTLAHSLSALTVQLEAVSALWDTRPDSARRLLDQASETARTGLAESRRALQALRASPLQDLGLILAVQELAEAAAKRSGAALELSLPGRLGRCPSPIVEQGIYRIAQETLENVIRHAGAHTIRVRLEQTNTDVTLTIDDDGQGVDLNALELAGAVADDRYGIRGMKERAALIGGRLEISSRAGQGTSVRLKAPVEGQEDGTCPDL
jgi:signal transduction histidine kinase